MENNAQIVTLTIPSQIGFEKTAMSVVQCLATEMGFYKKQVDRLKTALAEAVLNAMEHGNRFSTALDVTIQFMPHPKKIEIIVQDEGDGGGISLPTEEPDIDDKVGGFASKRGWGLFLIKKLVDEVEIDAVASGGSIVRIVSYL